MTVNKIRNIRFNQVEVEAKVEEKNTEISRVFS